MSTAVMTNRLELGSVAATALKAATRFWFAVTVVGQLAFAFAISSFYGLTAWRGDYHKWNFSHGYVPGFSMGNTAVVMHLVTAAIIMLAGAIQLVPQVRSRFPVFHRWTGRVYMLSAVALSAAGLYMTWFRGSVGDASQHLGSTLNAVLIWAFAALALRSAMARDFRMHRRWALRLFLTVSASWFLRIGLFLSFLVFKGPFGFDPVSFTGPFLTFMTFAQFLIPLTILEIYFRAQDHPGSMQKMATAGLLFVVTLAMGAGLFAVAMAVWVPQVKAGYDPRTSISETLAATTASSGVDQAVKQYYELKAAQPTTYNFDEEELNNLGYKLIRNKQFASAIRIFQLNIEAYPKSSNAYDSLAEGYMDNGDKALAIANYRRALQINPKNRNSELMLRKISVQ